MLTVNPGASWADCRVLIVFYSYYAARCTRIGSRSLETLEFLALLLGTGALAGVTLIGGEVLDGGQVGS